jgi:hypothetical protein
VKGKKRKITASSSSSPANISKKPKPKLDEQTKFYKQFHGNFFILDLQLKPYRTDEYVHKLFYETSRFSAFNHQWVVKAIINNSQRDPHQCSERELTYQVGSFRSAQHREFRQNSGNFLCGFLQTEI